jgi:DNA-binding beta-propeller fold protein YncE
MLGIKNINSDELNYFIKTSGDRPYGIAFDNKGLMYMVTAPETGNGMLSKVTPDGKVTHIAVIEGNFIGPGIYIDNEDNIFIAAGDRLLNVSPEGKIKIIADGFSRCFDVKLDKDKNIYLADDLQNTIYKITSGKKDIFYKGDTTGSFVLTGIVIDCENENLYAREGNRILKFHLQTNITQDKPEVILDKAGMFYMYMDNNNNIYASTLNNVIKVDTGRNVQYLSQKALKTSIGLAAGGRGFDENSLYVAVEDGIIKLPMSK